jgi:crossover junction endodeoxyribonuclease RuvC
MICFGIDPGLGRLGYGVVSQRGDRLDALDYGVITTEPGGVISKRLMALFEELEDKIAAHRPDAIAIERLYFGRNVTTAEMVFEARGVTLLAAARFGLIPYEVKPSEVKLAVCANGAAEKYQVQGMVKNLLSLDFTPKPDDVADALAVAITGLSLSSFDARSRMSAVSGG